LLRRLRLPPLKQLGQNFLVDEDVLQRTIRAADLTASDYVLEVGPGLGILTAELAKRAAHVLAVEIDKGMTAALKHLLQEAPNVRIVNSDILKFDPSEYFQDKPYKVVANLPYYITSPTLRHLLEARNKPTAMVLMVQKEVAERMVARPGDMSLLSISIQVYGEPKIITFVPPEAFYPAPKVDSAVVRIDVYPRPAVEVDLDKFFKVVQSGFSRPRKMLHNSLANSLWFPPGGAVEVLRAVGIDEKRRAETLSIVEWETLTREMARRGLV
jgi:16S rRNA (adenine1518-N6/adenine1519-N6)-dimethyltransferase